MARIGPTATEGNPVVFNREQVTLGLSVLGKVTAGAGIFDGPQKRLCAMKLGDGPELGLTLTSAPSRYAL